ncbi:MAG: nuclear transport factor 2 family protein [Chitinophagales bacterium]|nr:nuclear transport factor 2 family protein [Chitinophagales bacterium]
MPSQVYLLLIACCLFCCAATPVSAQNPVLDSELKRFEAMIARDTNRLRNFLTSDMIYVHSNGLEESRAQHLRNIAAGKIIYEAMNRESFKYVRYGRTAIVNGQIQVKGKLNQSPFEVKLLYTAVYRKRKGEWRLLRWQSTKP